MTERLLMILGPIEMDPAVLAALGQKTTSHLDPEFIETFGRTLERVREVFLAPSAQPFVIAGTGTPLVAAEGVRASTLSAMYFPVGVDASLVSAVRDEGRGEAHGEGGSQSGTAPGSKRTSAK